MTPAKAVRGKRNEPACPSPDGQHHEASGSRGPGRPPLQATVTLPDKPPHLSPDAARALLNLLLSAYNANGPTLEDEADHRTQRRSGQSESHVDHATITRKQEER